MDTTTDAALFNEDSLAKYAAIVFLNTTDTTDVLLNHYQEAAFERYIQAGGGFVGVHAAADDKGSGIGTSNIYIATDFIHGNEDLSGQGHQVVPETILGKNIALSLDCKSCHKVDEKSIGPSYLQVAQRYQKDSKASSLLIEKIIKGGAGNWGDVATPAHPTLKEGDAKMIAAWVLSLGAEKTSKSLPLNGRVIPQGDDKNKAFTLTASYTDLGGRNMLLTGSKIAYLRSNLLDLGKTRGGNGFDKKDSAEGKAEDVYLVFKKITPGTTGRPLIKTLRFVPQ